MIYLFIETGGVADGEEQLQETSTNHGRRIVAGEGGEEGIVIILIIITGGCYGDEMSVTGEGMVAGEGDIGDVSDAIESVAGEGWGGVGAVGEVPSVEWEGGGGEERGQEVAALEPALHHFHGKEWSEGSRFLP